MISDIDLLMFLISAIITAIIVALMSSGNNRVGNYGVGENDPPETSPPPLPGTRTRIFDCSPPEGTKPPEPKNQYGISTRVSENRDKSIPPYMDYDIKPSKEEIEKQAMKNLDDFKKVKVKIEYACSEAGITMEQALKFMDAFNEV